MTALTSLHTEALSLKGKRVLITGGTTGIGRAIARLLASEGAAIFTFGRHERELEDALKDISAVGGEPSGMVADASKKEDVESVFAESDRLLGGVDVLIANAAVGAEGLADESDEDWRYAVETNLVGYLAFARGAALRMKKQGGGHIVLIGSMSAEYRGKNSSVYVATKSALQGFAMSFRPEMAPHNIKVTLIEPGLVGSDMVEATPSAQRKKIDSGRMLRAEDIAVAVQYALTQPKRCVVMSMQIGELHRNKD